MILERYNHPNYTPDIPEYERNYVCPLCGEKVEWNGGSYCKDFTCTRGHMIDRNSLIKKEDYQPTVGLNIENRFQERVLRVDLVTTRSFEGLIYTPIQYETEAHVEKLIQEARSREEYPLALCVTFEDGECVWMNNLSAPLLDKWKWWSKTPPQIIINIERKLRKEMKEIMKQQKQRITEQEPPQETTQEQKPEQAVKRPTTIQKSILDYNQAKP